ncbi:hypothetical protein D3C86_2197390 [compost metagenome]
MLTAPLQQPGDVDGDAFGESLLLLGGGQPANKKQIFCIGCAGYTVLTRQPQRCQGTERQMTER